MPNRRGICFSKRFILTTESQYVCTTVHSRKPFNKKKIPLANTSEISLLPGNGPHLSIEHHWTKQKHWRSWAKSKRTPATQQKSGDMQKIPYDVPVNMITIWKTTSKPATTWTYGKSFLSYSPFLIGCHGTNRIYLPTIDHKNRQSMYINQGCRFGPESKPNSGKQYLDPAWYHLWRIVSEHVFWEHICKHCVKLECFAPILTKHSMYGTFTYVYHKD